MNLTVIADDRLIVVDGEALNFDFDLDSTIWAIQWDGTSGHIEYRDIMTQNEEVTDITSFQYLLDAFNAEKARLEALQEESV